MMAGSIKDWPALISQAYANLQPGGWLEFCEFEVWVHCQNDTEVPQLIHKWQTGLTEAGERIGRTFDVAPNLKRWMEEAGFVEITENIIKVYFNSTFLEYTQLVNPANRSRILPGQKTPAGRRSASTSSRICWTPRPRMDRLILRACWAGQWRSSRS